ncbi:MAG TPA: ubiquitin-like domain-containing protein [Mycobacteriales bacterium]
MDGNSSERGRHRHRAHIQKPPAVEDPQWTSSSSDRPQWTAPEPRSWCDKQDGAGGATRWNRDQDVPAPARWRPVSELTDTAWGAGAAWHDPQAPWNMAAGPAGAAAAADRDTARDASRDADLWTTDSDAAWGGTAGGGAGWNQADRTRSGWNEADRNQADRNQADRNQAGWNGSGGDQAGWSAAGWNAAGAPTDAAWTSSADEPGAVAVLDRPDGPAPERRHAVRHPLRLGLFALVLFGLVAGSVAWMSMDKSVQLRIDGEARSIKTYASTVGGVLDDQKIVVGAHDTLAPGREARISDGSEIVLRRGRLVTLTVDGKPRQVWTTATTVQEALEQVGYRQSTLFVSADRSTRLPLEGYQLTLRTPKTVTIVADGRKRTITTTVPTVGEAMAEAGVTVDGDDRVSQLAGATVRAGMTITVTRVLTKTRTTQAVVEYKTVEKTDPKAAAGSRTVKTEGVNGMQQVTRVETYVNGKLTSSKVAKVTVLKAPVDEVVVLGPELPEEAAPPPSQPAECADFPTTGGLNWCGLAKCESGLNPSAYNPAGPYYGLYQFDQQTWTANGGAGSPSGKSIAEQTAVAYTLYQARGASPWPVCGRNL